MNRCGRTARLYNIGTSMQQSIERTHPHLLDPAFRVRLAAAIRHFATELGFLGKSSGRIIRHQARRWGVSFKERAARRRDEQLHLQYLKDHAKV